MKELATQTGQEEPLAVPEQRPKTPIAAGNTGVKFQSMEDMWRFCVACVNSGQFKDIASPEVALIRMQAGMELGLTPIWSLTNIMVTNGKPSVWGDGLLGLILSRPDCEDVIETSRGAFPNDDYTAVCEVRRKGRTPVVRDFSVADAKKAGIFGKNVHAQYPKRMLQMRARSWACRDAYADALRGLSVREEVESVQPPKAANARVVSTGITLPKQEGGEPCAPNSQTRSANAIQTQPVSATMVDATVAVASEGGGDVQPVAAPESGEFQWEGDK